MKKITLFLSLALLAITTSVSAQFSIGPKVGLNVSNYTGGNIKANALMSYHVGGIMSIGIGNVFSIQPEVLLSSQGAKVENQGSKENYKVSYVAVPVMFKVRTGSGLYFELGPQASFKTSENIKDQTIQNFAKSLDLSVGGGLGYQSGGGLGIGARYLAGISKVGDFDSNNIDPDFKNSLIQVSLFYAIPLFK
jgi:hypothetical protein